MHEHKHTETWNTSAITDASHDQKRINVCEHVVKMESHAWSLKVPPGVCCNPWWHLSKTLIWCHLYHVFTYIYSLLIVKGICDSQNISSFRVFVFVHTIIQRVFSFFFYLLSYPYFGTFLSTWSQLNTNVIWFPGTFLHSLSLPLLPSDRYLVDLI